MEMKKILFILTGIALLLAGCTRTENEEVVPEKGKHHVTLKATVDKPDTRVSVDSKGYFSWQAGDKIAVYTYNGEEYRVHVLETQSTGKTALFEYDVEDDEGVVYAIYPVPDGLLDDPGNPNDLYFTMNSQLEYAEGATNMPMYGEIDWPDPDDDYTITVSFKSLCGLLVVETTNIPADADMLLVRAGGKSISGTFTMTEGDDGEYEINNDEIGGGDMWGDPDMGEPGIDDDCISIHFTQEEEKPLVFYIPVPVGTYFGFEFLIGSFDDGPIVSKSVSFSDGFEVMRNDIIVTPPLDATPNYPTQIGIELSSSYESEPVGDVLHVDQFDDAIPFEATISGNPEQRLEGFNETLISCELVDVNDPTQDPIQIEYEDIDYNTDCSVVNVTVPTTLAGEYKLVVTYTSDDPDQSPITAETSFTIYIHEAKEIPATLADGWSYSDWMYGRFDDQWFQPYRVDRRDIDGKVYLKTYAASLRTEPLPRNAFRNAFTNPTTGGSFDAFAYFSQVTSIPSNAFDGCEYMTAIKLPPLVETIESEAFKDCSGLGLGSIEGIEGTIVLPDGVETIGDSAFSGCSNLREITISSSSALNSIGESAFNQCSSLGSFFLPSGVTLIPDRAFYGCSALSSINLGNVTSIGAYSFDGCAFTSISLDGCTVIRYGAFEGCSALTTISIVASSEDEMEIYSSAFESCTNLTSISLPNTLRSIPSRCFYGCTHLESINLPASLLSIDEEAFSESGLTSITLPTALESIASRCFYGCNSLESISLPASLQFIGNEAFRESGLTSITLPDALVAIPKRCFYDCSSLESINLPTSLQSIGNEAFYGSGLSSIALPSSITSIGDSVFEVCAITSLVIPESVENIGNYAFGLSFDYVVFNSTTPPSIGFNCFMSIDSGFKAYVPDGSVQQYKTDWYGYIDTAQIKSINELNN